jgi:hypothetical protein
LLPLEWRVQGRGGKPEKENEMHGPVEMMVIRQHHTEIRREAAVNRLVRELRANRKANREGRSRLVADARWELSRYAGLLMKRLRNVKQR